MKDNFNNSLHHAASEEEREIILQHARFGRLVTKIFVICVYYIEIIMVVSPIFLGRNSDPVRKDRYPLCAWYYWDQESGIIYAITYVAQVGTRIDVLS